MFSASSQRLYRSIQRNISRGRPRESFDDQSGFTLVELLVVVMIIGILAAIAIPSFLGQKNKAVDVQAKELVRTAETAAESVASVGTGGYENVTVAELSKSEPSIRTVAGNSEAYLSAVSSNKTSYAVTVTAANGDEFKISKSATGQITRECASPVAKTGCSGKETATW